MPTIRSEPTPNPNSLKFTADTGSFLDGGMEAFRSAEAAADHPVGEPLWALDGVADVFITPQFVTVTKTPSADWSDLQPNVMTVLEDVLGH